MPLFPIPDADVGWDPDSEDTHPNFSHEYLNLLDELGLRLDEAGVDGNDEVVRLIRSYMDEAFSASGNDNVAERVLNAWSLSDKARHGKSGDENLRNAERFLYGLSASTNHNLVHMLFIKELALPYEELKALAHALKDTVSPGLEYWLRSNKDNPTSKPSFIAIGWADRGLNLGLRLVIKGGGGRFDVQPAKSVNSFKSQKPGLRDVPDMQFRKP